MPGIAGRLRRRRRAPEHHWQTFATAYNPAFSRRDPRADGARCSRMALDERKIIARRCAMELRAGAVVESRPAHLVLVLLDLLLDRAPDDEVDGIGVGSPRPRGAPARAGSEGRNGCRGRGASVTRSRRAGLNECRGAT